MPPDDFPSRREFLTLRGPAGARGESLAGGQPMPEAATATGAMPYLLHFARRAMACEFQLFFNAGQYDGVHEAALRALDCIDAVEAQLSAYRATSELMYVNQHAASRPVAIEPQFFALLEQCVELYRATGGAFDITAGPLSKVWGFFYRRGVVPEPAALQEALRRVGSDKLLLDAEHGTVQFAVEGMELNPGSIGKGYALDRAARILEQAGMVDFLWHGGHSSVLARGSRGNFPCTVTRGSAGQPAAGAVSARAVPAGAHHAAPQRSGTPAEHAPVAGALSPAAAAAGAAACGIGWKVGIPDPLRPGKRLAELTLCNEALATSGAEYQFFRLGKRRFGHILDPRTGQPAEGVYAATVVAPTAAHADALSTAFYVLGPGAASVFCRQRSGYAALLVCPGERTGEVRLYAEGFRPGQLVVTSPHVRWDDRPPSTA
jgi:thiamine biosynthesis lipoprotein